MLRHIRLSKAPVGFEPTTIDLTGRRSTAELQSRRCRVGFEPTITRSTTWWLNHLPTRTLLHDAAGNRTPVGRAKTCCPNH